MKLSSQHDVDLPEIWCIVPHFGPDEILNRCLASLAAVDYPAHLFSCSRILVVNHNPPNPNLLFTAGVNNGLRWARSQCSRKHSADQCLFWILNNDTCVDQSCPREAAKCFVEMGWEKTGLVGSKVLLMDNPDAIVWGGSRQCFPAGVHKTGFVSQNQLTHRTEETWISYCSVFINQSVVDEIGLLDSNLRHVYSDADYCLRARAQNWKCYYEPTSVVSHTVGTSARGGSINLNNVMARDKNYFETKWLRPAELFNRLTHVIPQSKLDA